MELNDDGYVTKAFSLPINYVMKEKESLMRNMLNDFNRILGIHLNLSDTISLNPSVTQLNFLD